MTSGRLVHTFALVKAGLDSILIKRFPAIKQMSLVDLS
jgi:hypothetical protein